VDGGYQQGGRVFVAVGPSLPLISGAAAVGRPTFSVGPWWAFI
jgi:hypothetical protein